MKTTTTFDGCHKRMDRLVTRWLHGLYQANNWQNHWRAAVSRNLWPPIFCSEYGKSGEATVVSHVKQNGAFSSLVAALTSSVSCKDTQRLMSEPRPQLTGIGRAVTPAMWYRLGVPPVQLRPPAPLYYHRSSSSPPPTTPAATQPRRRGLDQTQPSAGSKSRRGGNPLPSADAQLDVDFSPVDVHLTPGGVVHCVFVVNQIIVLRLFDCSSSSSALIMSFDWLHCFSRLPSITMKCNHAASCRHELPNTSVLWIW